MAYITYAEFVDLVKTDVDENKFDQLITMASVKLDYVTQNFYQFNDLETDQVEFRKKKFKLAVALQVRHMAKTGIETAHDADSQPIATSQNIGGTSVSVTYADSSNKRVDRFDGSIPKDVIECLSGTGLLFRGVNYVRY